MTADETSPCTALIIAYGFDKNSVMIDHTARREYFTEPITDYPSEILACHENHLATVRQNMVSPVKILYGVHVQQRMDQLIKPKSLDLWGSYKGITLHLEREFPEAETSQNQGRLLRFLIYAKHPQCFLSAWSKKWAMEQDRILGVAYRLACVAFTENLLQKRAWQQLVNIKPHSHYAVNKKAEEQSMEAILEIQTQLLSSDVRNVVKKSRSRVKTLTKKLNPPTAENRTQCLTGLKFDHENLEPDVDKTNAQTSESSQETLKEDSKYYIKPKRRSGAENGLLQDHDELETLYSQIQVQCIHCLKKTVFGKNKCAVVIDTEPRWTRTDPSRYIERYLLCGTCKTHRRLIPIDEKIPTLSAQHFSNLYKSASHLPQETQLQRLGALRPASKVHRFQRAACQISTKNKRPRHVEAVWEITAYDPKRPQIEVECSFCRGKGPDDKHPLWHKVTGEYLALRFFGCKSRECYPQRRHWIPQNKMIPYVYQRTLECRLKQQIAQEAITDKSAALTTANVR